MTEPRKTPRCDAVYTIEGYAELARVLEIETQELAEVLEKLFIAQITLTEHAATEKRLAAALLDAEVALARHRAKQEESK